MTTYINIENLFKSVIESDIELNTPERRAEVWELCVEFAELIEDVKNV